ncbi:MAG: hypothetical protein ABIY39_04595, partial [Sphingomonas sp.]
MIRWRAALTLASMPLLAGECIAAAVPMALTVLPARDGAAPGSDYDALWAFVTDRVEQRRRGEPLRSAV